MKCWVPQKMAEELAHIYFGVQVLATSICQTGIVGTLIMKWSLGGHFDPLNTEVCKCDA